MDRTCTYQLFDRRPSFNRSRVTAMTFGKQMWSSPRTLTACLLTGAGLSVAAMTVKLTQFDYRKLKHDSYLGQSHRVHDNISISLAKTGVLSPKGLSPPFETVRTSLPGVPAGVIVKSRDYPSFSSRLPRYRRNVLLNERIETHSLLSTRSAHLLPKDIEADVVERSLLLSQRSSNAETLQFEPEEARVGTSAKVDIADQPKANSDVKLYTDNAHSDIEPTSENALSIAEIHAPVTVDDEGATDLSMVDRIVGDVGSGMAVSLEVGSPGLNPDSLSGERADTVLSPLDVALSKPAESFLRGEIKTASITGGAETFNEFASNARPTFRHGQVSALVKPMDSKLSRAASQAVQLHSGIVFEVSTRVNGVSTGRLSLLIVGADIEHSDEAATSIAVPLQDLVHLFSSQLSSIQLERFLSSKAIHELVTLNDLREAGIKVAFNEHDELVLRVK